MRRFIAALGVAVAAAALVTATPASADSGRTLFVRSAVEHADGTVTLPLHQGVSHGRPVWTWCWMHPPAMRHPSTE